MQDLGAMADVTNVSAAIQAAYGPQALDWWKLHKLLYFSQGWALAWTGQPLFADRIEAWRRGPVVRSIYRMQRHYPLTPPGSADALTASQRDMVGEVVRFYGAYKTHQLIGLTHREPPWRAARRGVEPGAESRNPITRESMHEYFTSLADVPRQIPEGVRRTIDVLLSVPEDQIDRMFEDSGVDFDAELAYLRGQGANPWPPATNHR